MKKSDVMKYVIELTVVFIGITGAFLLNSWREDFKDSQLEKKYLLSFKQEIQDNGRELENIIGMNTKKNEQLSGYLRMIVKDQVPVDSAVSILGELLRNYPLMPKTDTYTSITGSGNLNLISDFTLKEDIIAYYNGYENVKLQETVYLNYVNNYAIPFVYDHMDMAVQSLDSPETSHSLAFRNLVVGYSMLLRQNLRLYDSMLELNAKLEARLENIK